MVRENISQASTSHLTFHRRITPLETAASTEQQGKWSVMGMATNCSFSNVGNGGVYVWKMGKLSVDRFSVFMGHGTVAALLPALPRDKLSTGLFRSCAPTLSR